MPKRTCPYCDAKAHMKVVNGKFSAATRIGEASAECAECGRINVARFSIDSRNSSNDPAALSVLINRAVHQGHVEWIPARAASPEIEDVPGGIKSAAQEAHSCLSVGNLRAAIMLARAVIEATAKDRGISQGTLFKKIDEMEERGIIRAHIKEAAHELRHAGNDMAHGDFGATPNSEDAEDFIEIMMEILNEVFQSPARTDRLRARRQAAK